MSEEIAKNRKVLICLKFKLRKEFKNIPGLTERFLVHASVRYSKHVLAVKYNKDKAIEKAIKEFTGSLKGSSYITNIKIVK